MNSKAFFSDKPIAYHPILAKICGSVTAALFLSQIAFWNDKGDSQDGWIWKTQEEMTNETGLSRSEQETARKTLVRLNILQEERRGVPARMWYLINWEVLDDLIENAPQTSCRKPAIKKPKTCNQDVAKPANYSEITPESTTESTTISRAPQTESEEFAAVFQTVESAMHGMEPTECEQLRELWEDVPDLEAHHFAYLQTIKYAASFNLAYYRKCLYANRRQNAGTQASPPRPTNGNGRRGTRADALALQTERTVRRAAAHDSSRGPVYDPG